MSEPFLSDNMLSLSVLVTHTELMERHLYRIRIGRECTLGLLHGVALAALNLDGAVG